MENLKNKIKSPRESESMSFKKKRTFLKLNEFNNLLPSTGDDEGDEKERKPSSKPGSFIAEEGTLSSPRKHGLTI